MTTKNTTPTSTDPLAGLPVADPTTAPPTGGKVVNLAKAKAKLTGQAYKDARDFARKATGYDDTSPIWGKRMPVVLTEIEADLNKALDHLTKGEHKEAIKALADGLVLNQELQKRIATGQLISAQR